MLCFVVVILPVLGDPFGLFNPTLQGCSSGLGQSYDCPRPEEQPRRIWANHMNPDEPRPSEATSKNMDKIDCYLTITRHNRRWTEHILLVICCISMTSHKTVGTPSLIHWSYRILALRPSISPPNIHSMNHDLSALVTMVENIPEKGKGGVTKTKPTNRKEFHKCYVCMFESIKWMSLV